MFVWFSGYAINLFFLLKKKKDNIIDKHISLIKGVANLITHRNQKLFDDNSFPVSMLRNVHSTHII